jgi:hypothetical protein
MQNALINLEYEVEVRPGERLMLPETLSAIISPGRWLITIRPSSPVAHPSVVRSHSAFLNSYAPEDEGLYDDPIG